MSQNIDPKTAFREQIWVNDELCNNCFRRCREIVTGTYCDATTREEHGVTQEFRTSDGEVGYALIDIEAAAQRVPRARTTCSGCGSVGLLNQADDPLSTAAMGQRVDRIADYLEAGGYAVDREKMHALVNELKDLTPFAGRDYDIFCAVVEKGLRAAASGD